MTLASLQVNALIWTIMDSRVRVEGYQRKVHIGNYQYGLFFDSLQLLLLNPLLSKSMHLLED